MGARTGPLRVYGATRLRWLAPLLRPGADIWVWSMTLIALSVDRPLAVFDIIAAVVVAVALVSLWAGVWAARLAAPRVEVVDRYNWEQIDDACKTIVKHLPRASALSRKEIRQVTEAARWELARLLRDRSRLADLQRAADRSAAELADDDPIRDELSLRQTTFAEQFGSVQAEVESRIGRLRSPATQSSSVTNSEAAERRKRKAAEEAQLMVSQADVGIEETAHWADRTDPAADFAERAEAVLTAYRELSDDHHGLPNR